MILSELCVYFRSYFNYDHQTGVLTRKPGLGGARINFPVGKVTDRGYKIVQTKKGFFAYHRIVWEYVKGSSPPLGYVLDHVDRDTSNNRIENLRLATLSQNTANSSTFKNKKYTSLKGVSAVKYRDGSVRYVCAVRGKHIGTFKTAQEAHLAYVEKAKETWGKFACPG